MKKHIYYINIIFHQSGKEVIISRADTLCSEILFPLINAANLAAKADIKHNRHGIN